MNTAHEIESLRKAIRITLASTTRLQMLARGAVSEGLRAGFERLAAADEQNVASYRAKLAALGVTA